MELLVNPVAWVIIVLLSALGVAASMPTFFLGRKGIRALKEHFPNVHEERWEELEAWFNRWGVLLLLLTALPGFGTVLPPAAGANGVRTPFFVAMVAVGKFLRYWILALLIYGGARAAGFRILG